MICYSYPRYPGEITELLKESGRTTQQSQLLIDNPNSRITILINNGWLKKLSKEETEEIIKEIDDKRAKRRHYIQSTIEPLIEYFNKQIPLAKNEKRQLKHLLEKDTFKEIFSWENGFRSFDIVKEFLFQLTLWFFISNKYTEPYRIKDKSISPTKRQKLFSEIIEQLFKKRNEIADRIAPKLKIEFSDTQKKQFYNFISDATDKLKSPLLEKLMKLSNNRIILEMNISMLACGEFVNEFQYRSQEKHN